MGDYMEAFTSPDKRPISRRVHSRGAQTARRGADVIVPTGGIPMMLFGNVRGANVDGAPVVTA